MQNKSIIGAQKGALFLKANPELQEKIQYLEGRIIKLGDICNEINPYLAVSAEFKIRLREFNIIEASDPFHLTNALLRLLEDSIKELHQLRPLSEDERHIENLR
jgi:hypothetical protein